MNNPLYESDMESLKRYISSVFRPCTLLGEWADAHDLPLYLQANRRYQQLSLDGRNCLLMWDCHGQQHETAQKLKKSIAAVSDKFTGPVIYGVRDTTSYNRKRLIDQGIAFVVPGRQLYLPFAALDLRENFMSERRSQEITAGACAQQLVLLKCSGFWEDQLPAQTWAQRLGVSKMTVSRAYQELAGLGLAHINFRGRQAHLEFEFDGRQLWQAALSHLSSPVKKQISISIDDSQLQPSLSRWSSGVWALASQTGLASPATPCFAISAIEWASIKKVTGIDEVLRQDEDTVQLELWRYDPAAIEQTNIDHNHVDPLSLYLSLRDMTDERVQMALDELLDRFWNDRTARLK